MYNPRRLGPPGGGADSSALPDPKDPHLQALKARPEELKKLGEFKLSHSNDLFQPLENGEVVLDETGLRFLRARKFDFEKTRIMLQKSRTWREKMFPEGFVPLVPKPCRSGYVRLLGSAKDESPVCWLMMGYQNLWSWSVEEHTRNSAFNIQLCYEMGMLKRTSVKVYSLADLSYWTMRHNFQMTAHVESVKMAQDNFPETCGLWIIMNAPFYFQAAFRVFTRNMTQEEKDTKIRFLNGVRLHEPENKNSCFAADPGNTNAVGRAGDLVKLDGEFMFLRGEKADSNLASTSSSQGDVRDEDFHSCVSDESLPTLLTGAEDSVVSSRTTKELDNDSNSNGTVFDSTSITDHNNEDSNSALTILKQYFETDMIPELYGGKLKCEDIPVPNFSGLSRNLQVTRAYNERSDWKDTKG